MFIIKSDKYKNFKDNIIVSMWHLFIFYTFSPFITTQHNTNSVNRHGNLNTTIILLRRFCEVIGCFTGCHCLAVDKQQSWWIYSDIQMVICGLQHGWSVCFAPAAGFLRTVVTHTAQQMILRSTRAVQTHSLVNGKWWAVTFSTATLSLTHTPLNMCILQFFCIMTWYCMLM